MPTMFRNSEGDLGCQHRAWVAILHAGSNTSPCQSKETPLVTKVSIGRVHNGWGAWVQTLCWHGKCPRHVVQFHDPVVNANSMESVSQMIHCRHQLVIYYPLL